MRLPATVVNTDFEGATGELHAAKLACIDPLGFVLSVQHGTG